MTKDSTKKQPIIPLVIFIGRCWQKKYDSVTKQIKEHIESKYNKGVTVITRFKRTSPTVQVHHNYRNNV